MNALDEEIDQTKGKLTGLHEQIGELIETNGTYN